MISCIMIIDKSNEQQESYFNMKRICELTGFADMEIDELTQRRENPYDEDENYHSLSSSSISDDHRSVFDDVDKWVQQGALCS